MSRYTYDKTSKELDIIAGVPAMDGTPVEDSIKPITSGGVYDALNNRPKETIITSSTTTISGLPNNSPMLIYIWNAGNVQQYIVARIYLRSAGQTGNYEIIKNNTLTISAIGDGSITISGSNDVLSYKIIC